MDGLLRGLISAPVPHRDAGAPPGNQRVNAASLPGSRQVLLFSAHLVGTDVAHNLKLESAPEIFCLFWSMPLWRRCHHILQRQSPLKLPRVNEIIILILNKLKDMFSLLTKCTPCDLRMNVITQMNECPSYFHIFSPQSSLRFVCGLSSLGYVWG